MTSTRSSSPRSLYQPLDHRLQVLALVVGREADTDHAGSLSDPLRLVKGCPEHARSDAPPSGAPYHRRHGGDLLATRMWPSSSTSSPTCSSSTGAAVPGARAPPGGRPDPFLRAQSPSLHSTDASRPAGIGKTIESKIVQIVNGARSALTKRKAQIPAGVAEAPASRTGPKTARRIWQELGITTVEELRKAAEAERLRRCRGWARRQRNASSRRSTRSRRSSWTLLAVALPAVRAVVEVLRDHPASDEVSEAGSVRRRTETVKDLDIIATASDPAALTEYFTKLTWVAEVEAKGKTKAAVVSHDGLRFDLRVVPPEAYGNLLQHFTGSKRHNVELREDAVRRGLDLRIRRQGRRDRRGLDRAHRGGLYERLGYQWMPPELREGRGEIGVAKERALPKLVEVSDRGRPPHALDVVERRQEHARGNGVRRQGPRLDEYVAITDHAHYLREGRFEAQAKEIAKLQKKLSPFSFSAASRSASASTGLWTSRTRTWQMRLGGRVVAFRVRQEPTERILAAMENPHVDCIGHPTARKLNKRVGVDLDIEKIAAKGSRRGRPSRSTPSPTASTFGATPTRGPSARRACRS